MATINQTQRRQLIARAEGFLELATALGDDRSLSVESRTRMADRCLACLNRIESPLGHKPYVLFLKGQAARLAQRHELAVHYLEQSRRIDPDNIHVCFALAWSLKRCGRLDQSVATMRQAVELDATSPLAHYNLACYLALQGDIDKALWHLACAVELNDELGELAWQEPDFEPIRTDPRFASLAANVKSA